MQFERLYSSDSFLRTFSAIVTDVRPLPPVAGQPMWKVALDRSAFYPTSGGQPFDTGVLCTQSPAGAMREIPVEQVEEDDEGMVWHFVREPLTAGAHADAQIHWDRRFDHMQQHSGQHLLSAVFLRELQAPTVSFHLGDSISTIDIAIGPPPARALERVEEISNQIIAEDRPVTTRSVSRGEAEAMLNSGALRKLPERDGAIRLIEIAGCDLNACGGTHVRSTGQIGGLLVRRIEKVSRGVRVEFVCGMRAVQTARADAALLTEAAGLLSIGTADLPEAVKRLLAESKSAAREVQKLREELAVLQGAAIAAEFAASDGPTLIMRGWSDRDRDFVKLLASRTAAAAPSIAVVFSARSAEAVGLYVACSPDLGIHCGQILREALAPLGLRGGGSATLAQGEVPAVHEADVIASLSRAMRRCMPTLPDPTA